MRRQCGEGLVGMMIGLLVALVTVLAMLMAYRTTVAVAVPATRSAMREAQVASALLAAQMELQQAGYGMLPADGGTNVFVDNGGRRIVWRYRQNVGDAAFLCAGLQLVASTPVDPDTDGLYRLPPVACASANAPPAWAGASAPQLLASEAALFEPGDEARRYELSAAQFQLQPNQNCGPFGISAGTATRTRVLLVDVARTPAVAIFSYCLTNA